MKRAFLFPGQGAQVVGMGKDIYEKYEEARKVYDKVSEISEIDIKKICFEGPEEELIKTENAQLAILTTSLAILEVLKQKGIEAQIAVGLSLGEYGALIYGEIIGFEQGIKLIKHRGYCMGTYLPKEEFAMSAVIGLESAKIEEICEEIRKNGNFVVPANYNYSGQTVISGNKEALQEAEEKLKEAGARKVIPLKTSGPFHTEKLKEAKEHYEKELGNVVFNIESDKVKVIKNLDGTVYKREDNIKEILSNHIINPVRFDKAIKLMQDEKVEQYIEIGPGKALTGFIKKENKEANVFNIYDVNSLEEFCNMQK